jgi:hypothetical protein
MDKILDEIFAILIELGYYKKYHDICLFDLPDKINLQKGKLPVPQENEMFIFGKGYMDIPIGASFDVIFPARDVKNYIYTNSILKYVSVNPSYEIDYLPCGYTGMCLLDFSEGKPEILKKLAIFGEKKDYSIHDTLILTQKPILDKILKELEKYGK